MSDDDRDKRKPQGALDQVGDTIRSRFPDPDNPDGTIAESLKVPNPHHTDGRIQGALGQFAVSSRGTVTNSTQAVSDLIVAEEPRLEDDVKAFKQAAKNKFGSQ